MQLLVYYSALGNFLILKKASLRLRLDLCVLIETEFFFLINDTSLFDLPVYPMNSSQINPVCQDFSHSKPEVRPKILIFISHSS